MRIMNEFENCIEQIYTKKKIVIGLTGRTGSGCSTAAKILSTRNYTDLKFKKSDQYSFSYDKNEIKKFEIIKKYIEMKNYWKPFNIIKISNIILDIILDKELKEFENYINILVNQNKDRYLSFAKLPDFIREIKENFEDGKKEKNKCELDNKRKEYYFVKLPIIFEQIKNIMKKYTITERIEGKTREYNCYFYLMQRFGNNIRSSGNPYDSNFTGENYFDIAKKIEQIINTYFEDGERICIDAIRNPYEAMYLKDHCNDFYLISINAEEEDRNNRFDKRFSVEQIENIDEIECPKKFNNIAEQFYHQDIQKCLEITDIHLNNIYDNKKESPELIGQIIKYITLILHPGLVTPTKIERCMQAAYEARVNSGCLSRKVGAAITDENYVIKSIGWNDVPSKQVPCNLRCLEDYFYNDKELFSKFELEDFKFQGALIKIKEILKEKRNNIPYSYCFKDIYNYINKGNNQVHTRALHAEENAFLNISIYGGEGLKGGNLFVTASPCELCSKKSYQIGIKNIYYIDPYPGISKKHILGFENERTPNLQLFSGAIGAAYFKLYMPKISYKDELELRTGIVQKKVEEPNKKEFEVICEEVLLIIEKNEFIYKRVINGKSKINNLEYIERMILFSAPTCIMINTINDIKYDKCEIIYNQDNNKKISHKLKLAVPKKIDENFNIGFEIHINKSSIVWPFLMNKIVQDTNKLIMKIIDNNNSLKNVNSSIYFDETRNKRVIEAKVIKINNEYIVEFLKPNNKFLYCIEWENKDCN